MRSSTKNRGSLALFTSFLAASCSHPTSRTPLEPALQWDGTVSAFTQSRRKPEVATQGMVVADDRQAAEWGAEILRQGGNAVDAAVATVFAMSVTRPHYASLGGGGFLVYCPAPKEGKPAECQALDFRESAPAAATRDLYIREGKPRTDLSQDGALASGVPGLPAGLLESLEKLGKLPRQKLLRRPIELAKKGIRVSGMTEKSAADRWKVMNAEARRVFGCGQTDRPCQPGMLLRQPELARVLEALSEKGRAGFYQGEVARKLSQGLRDAGGIITEQDLAAYRPRWLKPLHAQRYGKEIVTMPPPSSGGVLLLQLLGYSERAAQQGALSRGYGSAESIHATTHGLSLAFADRAQYLGDPEFTAVPGEALTSADYLDRQWKSFNPGKMNLPERPGELGREGQHTTHLSVIDAQGNAAALTVTINDFFGSGFVPPATGIVMNNEMDDFSIQPGVPNLFGLVGAEANAIAPGKRPLSSMTPTVVRDPDGQNRIVIGAAGGPRIITAVYLSLLNRLQYGMSLPDAVITPRFHHQWKPTSLRLERLSFAWETRERLRELGYTLEEVATLATVHALERFPETGRVWGIADPRGEGGALPQ